MCSYMGTVLSAILFRLVYVKDTFILQCNLLQKTFHDLPGIFFYQPNIGIMNSDLFIGELILAFSETFSVTASPRISTRGACFKFTKSQGT